MDLNIEQSCAVENVKNGKNIFLTGSAGSGKSFCVQHIINYALSKKLKIGITALTGSASILINGTTLHSFMKIGLAKESPEVLVHGIRKYREVFNKLKELDMLLIDEVSMMSDILFDKINKIFQIIKYNSIPFGGVQMVFVGDGFQLPSIDGGYCFQSANWESSNFQVHLLKINMRQKDDLIFKELLSRVRWGTCSREDYLVLKKLKKTTFAEGIVPTRQR
jgi:ATP-dependent DNA helicase PIF1